MRWRSVGMAILGAWFVVSAWAMPPIHDASLWMSTVIILGGLTLIGSVWAVWENRRRAWRDWVQAVFGVYLGLTPFFYGFTGHTAALWVTMVAGALMALGGVWNAVAKKDTGHSAPIHRAA
jgi:hypothetical protein